MNRRLIIGGIVVLALLIALIVALTGGGEDPVVPAAAGSSTTADIDEPTTVTEATVPPDSTTSAPTPTTTITTTSAVPTDDPQFPDTSGDDYGEILRELIDYHNWAHQNPADANPAVYLDPECECFAQVDQRLAEWAENGWREIDEGIVVSEVLVLFEASNSIRLRMIDEHVPLTVVDVGGAVVETRDARGLTRNSITIVRNDADTGWVINEWVLQGSAGG